LKHKKNNEKAEEGHQNMGTFDQQAAEETGFDVACPESKDILSANSTSNRQLHIGRNHVWT